MHFGGALVADGMFELSVSTEPTYPSAS